MPSKKNNEPMENIFSENLLEAYSYCKIICDESGCPCDYKFIDVNSRFEDIIGLSRNEIIDQRASIVFSDLINETIDWPQIFGDVALNGINKDFEFFHKYFGIWYHGTVTSPKKGYFITFFVEKSNSKKDIILELDEYYTVIKTITFDEKVLSIPREEIVGKNLRSIMPDIEDTIISACNKSVMTNKLHSFEYPFFSSTDQKWFRTEVKHFNIKDKSKYIVSISDITDQKRSELEILSKKEELDRFFTVNLDLLCIADIEGNFHRVNTAWSEILGYSVEDLENRNFFDFIHPDDIENTIKEVEKLATQKNVFNFVNRYKCKDESYKHIEWRSHPYGKFIYAAARDISDQVRSQEQRYLYSTILSILNEPIDMQQSISKILSEIKDYIGADAVGIRLKENGDYPYYFQTGFSTEFLLKENSLLSLNEHGDICRNKDGSISLECTCGLVITGNTDPSNPLFTPYGSAYSNNSFPFLDLPEDEDPRTNPRNKCIHEGYASIALVPIKIEDDIIGILQVNCYEKDMFDLSTVNLLEDIAASIGQALQRKQMESKLNQMYERLEAFHDHSPLLISELTISGKYKRVNKIICDILGKTREEIIGKSVQNVLPENTSALITEHIEDVLKSSSYVSFEHTLRLDDTERMIKTVIFPLFDETKNISSLGVIGEDITDLKKIEEFEKNQLIVHEIHHRVKNNLQVISSLLNMQSKLFEDEDVRDAFLDSQNRIRSMSLAHEKLYSTDKAGQIEMADYIKSLVDYISQLYKPINKTILTKLNTDTIYFDMDTAIPLSLLLNEIITNSYKHAFVGKDKGTISISFKKMEQEYQLVVQDDGTGFPENIGPENSNSLGFRIINLLSKQLFAEIEVDSSKGTSYTITIKK